MLAERELLRWTFVNLSPAIGLSGVAVAAISGTLEAKNNRMDIFGAIVVAIATALGGGTVRDLLLQHGPVFWIADDAPLIVTGVIAIITFIVASSPGASFQRALLVADAAALALFTVLGTEKALNAHAAPLVALVMGVITGVVGGILRDILCNQIPFVLRRDIYATASIAGAALFLLLQRLKLSEEVASLSCICVVFTIRIAVLRWKLTLPNSLKAPPLPLTDDTNGL